MIMLIRTLTVLVIIAASAQLAGCRRDEPRIAPMTGPPVAGMIAAQRGAPMPRMPMMMATKTDEEWRQILTPEQYRVMRKWGAEPAFSSPLDKEKRDGFYVCAACAYPLFSSATKYESGTGWPSFFQAIDSTRVGTTPDDRDGMHRTEVHCAGCGAHLGHVFSDGPPPTGLRYCMNGVAMKFVAQEGSQS